MIKSRRLRLEGHVVSMKKKKNACRVLVEKPKRQKQLGRFRRR
jgi:ribosomal protein S17